MQLTDIPFGTTDWSTVEVTEHPGDVQRALGRRTGARDLQRETAADAEQAADQDPGIE